MPWRDSANIIPFQFSSSATTSQAALNEWTAQGDAIPIPNGNSIVVCWNTAATPAPYLALYLRSVT